MSEDYKWIALEDVKKGQRVRVVERYPSYTATYEGVVVRTNTEWHEIVMGDEGYESTIFVPPEADAYFDTFLLEDAPKPKVVRTATVKYYDDGTKTETPDTTVWVSMSIKTMEQFEEYEDYLKQVVLKDRDGDYWTYRDGRWCWTCGPWLPAVKWCTLTDRETIEQSIPMTVVENVGD